MFDAQCVFGKSRRVAQEKKKKSSRWERLLYSVKKQLSDITTASGAGVKTKSTSICTLVLEA